ncbi:lysophospholipid acyltransferase family protein [Candidatus Pelagibacter sp. HIMB1483]|uniref:lysophospholipid acyltransferase family protein n=1 Tax=Candidatus Pelagibacter sp. HIMB1483 TaxID=3415414 RepID=UPI003F824F2D
MNKLKYFFQFILIIIIFFIFKILGVKISSFLGGKLFQLIGPFFRSKEIINKNIKRAFPNIDKERLNKLKSSMWNNYGRVFAEYMFLKNFRKGFLDKNITIDGEEILNKIKDNNQKVIFISGHFSNFELMAMQIDKLGLNIAAIYRPLNNIFLNSIMEKIRIRYICKNQIKKGIGGLKELMRLNYQGYSTALMIDQRVSQGIKSNFFGEKAFTTTIPAQLIKKFEIPVVPIFIERYENIKFKMKVFEPINFSKEDSIMNITDRLNEILENMILNDPKSWIWTHNRWK